MVFSVRVLTALTVAALAGQVADVRAQSADDLRSTVTEDAESAAMGPAPVPRLTISDNIEESATGTRRRSRMAANPYDPQGVSLGGLRLYPAIEVGSVFSSNIRQSSIDKQAGIGFSVAPSLRLESDWVRHSWQSEIRGNYTAYAKNSDASNGSVEASSRFRLDIRRSTYAEMDSSYSLTPTRPSDSGVVGGTEGRRLDQSARTGLSLVHDFGGFSARVRTGLERQIYGDEDLIGGGTRNNDDLNNWKPSASLRLSLTDSPAVQPFVEAGYTRRLHDDKTNAAGQNTDSGDIDLRLGASVDDGAFWSGEIALTYLRRDYKDSSLDRVQAFGINGNLTWRPTELTTIVADAETRLDDASTDGRNYALRLSASQAVRDNITLRANGSVSLQKDSDGYDVTYGAGAGVEYQIGPELAWTAGYDATVFRGANSDQNYTDHRLMMGIILRR